MAGPSFTDTLSKIAGNFNPNIARAHQEEARMELERQKFARSGDNAEYTKRLKQFQIYQAIDTKLAEDIRNRNTPVDQGQAARAALRAKMVPLAQSLGVDLSGLHSPVEPGPEEPDTALGKATAYRDQLLARQRQAEEAGDSQALASLQQDIEAAEGAIRATQPKPLMIFDPATGEHVAVKPHTLEPVASFTVTPRPKGGGEKRSGTFKSVFKIDGNKEVFVADIDSKSPELDRYQNSGYRIYNAGKGGTTRQTVDKNGNVLIERLAPGQERLGNASRKIEEQTLIGLQERRAKLETIAKQFKPEYMRFSKQLWNAGLTFVDKLMGMPDAEKAEYRQSKVFVQNAIDQMNDYIREMTGAAMGEAEAVRLRKAIADVENDGPTAFIAKIRATLAETKFAELRSWRRLHQGIDAPITDAETQAKGMRLGDPGDDASFGKGGEIGALLEAAAQAKEKELLSLLGRKPAGKDMIEFKKDVLRSVLIETFKVPVREVGRYVR